MKAAKELYPCEEDGYWRAPGDYQPILDTFGNILVQVDDIDWQGDSRVLYKDKGIYGYLQFGWGSCSGCDSLLACDSVEEVQQLMDDLYQSITWFNSASDAIHYFKTHDWEGDYCSNSKQKEFVSKVIEKLKEE